MTRVAAPPPSRRPGLGGKRRSLAIAVSVAAHLVLLPLLFLAGIEGANKSSPADEFDAVLVTLEPPPPPIAPKPSPSAEGGSPAASPSAAPETPSPPVVVPTPRPTPPLALRTRTPRPAPPDVPTVVASVAPAAFVGLSDAELGGATVAGSGSGSGAGSGSGTGAGSGDGSGAGDGGRCDMVRRIQDGLRANAGVRRTASEANRTLGRKALLMWDGDWLQSPGEAGKGLAGVRQAIALEIAFAPVACRSQSMRGLAVISLGDGPDSPRIALGAARWRWSDLSVGR